MFLRREIAAGMADTSMLRQMADQSMVRLTGPQFCRLTTRAVDLAATRMEHETHCSFRCAGVMASSRELPPLFFAAFLACDSSLLSPRAMSARAARSVAFVLAPAHTL